ncbi:MAG: 3-hydroxyacyl-CoA dehydrogenase family protein, partial [candidate division Zixibacteria bacterium]|nr:3-hydroxyacyl-CoA dehydrogenase family protein [candidate division Zixibacteria bacterium]
MTIKKLGIIGFGQMGSGIAQVAAAAGYPVVATDVKDEFLKKGLSRIEGLLNKAIEKGKATEEDKKKTLGNITTTTDLGAFADCDLVIEAIVENLDAKIQIFETIDRVCKPTTIFASNTSSLSITDMAVVTKRRSQFVGMHFFNPVPVMKLVEVVRTIITDDQTFNTAVAFAESVGKTVVRAKDTCGFVVNLLLIPYLIDAIRWYENGLATKEDIDNGMKLGCGHPMGPLEL